MTDLEGWLQSQISVVYLSYLLFCIFLSICYVGDFCPFLSLNNFPLLCQLNVSKVTSAFSFIFLYFLDLAITLGNLKFVYLSLPLSLPDVWLSLSIGLYLSLSSRYLPPLQQPSISIYLFLTLYLILSIALHNNYYQPLPLIFTAELCSLHRNLFPPSNPAAAKIFMVPQLNDGFIATRNHLGILRLVSQFLTEIRVSAHDRHRLLLPIQIWRVEHFHQTRSRDQIHLPEPISGF